MAARLWRPRRGAHAARGGRGELQLSNGRSDHDVHAAAACCRTRGSAEAQFVGAGNLRLDPDRRRLSQGHSVRRHGGGDGQPRPYPWALGASGGPRHRHCLDVPCARTQARRAADRRARMVLRRTRQAYSQPLSEAARGVINFGFFPSRRLAWYMVRLFLTRSIAVVLALVLILMTLDLLGESAKILAVPGNGDADLWRYVSYRLPMLASRFLPFSVVLCALFAFVGLNQNSEVVAMKAAGLSAHQILAPLVVASIALAGILFAFNEGVVVNATRAVSAWSDNDYKPVPRASSMLSNVWIMSGDDLVRARMAGGTPFVAENVTIYDRGGGNLQRVIEAARAVPDPARRDWQLQGVRIYDSNMNAVRRMPS